ncbi:MAG: GIY-YIG nuclease family protein [Candidatus Roizmanbacteria bacterium]|nr:GIY-YIG nuclease family protein [Candidatus Roizmanbacteria bacterium]
MKTLNTTLLPSLPGVYYFRDTTGKPVYIGKAKDIKKRVTQHLQDNKNPKEARIREASVSIDWRETNSEFEAILLEANLIKKYLPRYNIDLKDDRSSVYIVITKEDLPRVLLMRERQLHETPHRYYFGPLQSNRMARFLIRYLRTIVPFCTDRGTRRNPCFQSHIGLCSPCPGYMLGLENHDEQQVLRKQYRNNIIRLKTILEGKGDRILNTMRKDMEQASAQEDYERAAVIRDRLDRFEALFQKRLLFDDRLEDPLFLEGIRATENEALKQLLNMPKLNRLECYDISTFSGKQSVASMVVFIDGRVEKSHYRRFRIRGKGNFDPEMLTEVLLRRMKHDEWQKPDLIIIDGGGPQLRSVYPALKRQYASLPVIIGIAKRPDRIMLPDPLTVIPLESSSDALHYVQRVRDEAHRFAKQYHVRLRDAVSLVQHD